MASQATQPLEDGIYRIYFLPNGSASTLTMDRPKTTGAPPPVVGRPDDANAAANAYQQWIVKYEPKTKTYSIRNVGNGLYAVPTNFWLEGQANPCQWSIENNGKDTYAIYLRPTRYMVTLASYSSAAGTGAQIYQDNASTVAQRTWQFVKAKRTATPVPPLPIATLGPLRPGTYRIRNPKIKNYLAQNGETLASAPNGGNRYPGVTSQTFASDSLWQQWEVILHEPSQTYIIKNKQSGRFLSLVDGAWLQQEAVASDKEAHWELRTTEYEGMYAIHVPYINWSLDLWNGVATNNAQVVVYGRNGNPTSQHESWWFEPVDIAIQAETRQPVPYLLPIKTGTFYIRSFSNTDQLLTQLETIKPDSMQGNPNVVGLLYRSDNDFQRWKVRFQPDLRAYVIENVASGRYLSWVYSVTNVQASNVMRAWQIDHSDFGPTFTIHPPSISSHLNIGSGDQVNGLAVTTPAANLQPQQKWVFEPVDDGEDLVTPTVDDDGQWSGTGFSGSTSSGGNSGTSGNNTSGGNNSAANSD